MANFFTSSIGKKFLMSITGFFLISFISVHLLLNSFIVFDGSGDLFNLGAHFMASNPIIKVVEPILALGFLVHILYSIILTLQNLLARPTGYKKQDQRKASTWASRNMFILGSLIFIFLVIHLIDFFWKMKFAGGLEEIHIDGVIMEDAFSLVTGKFITWWYWLVPVYILGAIALGFHLQHAFWSAFQTLGWSNIKWRKRLDIIGTIYAVFIALGFCLIPIWVIVKHFFFE